MIYFSEILHKGIYTDQKMYLGRLKDLIFVVKDRPYITKMVVGGEKEVVFPLSSLKSINGRLIIASDVAPTHLDENELYINKNVLDQQIIDIAGNKVVRANDVVLQNKPEWYLSGIDISLYGILRWFGLERLLITMLKLLTIAPTPEILFALIQIEPPEPA